MQAGRQRGALPLIRKFNEHSERLLNSALYVLLVSFSAFLFNSSITRGDVSHSKRRRVDGGDGEVKLFSAILIIAHLNVHRITSLKSSMMISKTTSRPLVSFSKCKIGNAILRDNWAGLSVRVAEQRARKK